MPYGIFGNYRGTYDMFSKGGFPETFHYTRLQCSQKMFSHVQQHGNLTNQSQQMICTHGTVFSATMVITKLRYTENSAGTYNVY